MWRLNICLITESNVLAVYLLNLRRDLFTSMRLTLCAPWKLPHAAIHLILLHCAFKSRTHRSVTHSPASKCWLDHVMNNVIIAPAINRKPQELINSPTAPFLNHHSFQLTAYCFVFIWWKKHIQMLREFFYIICWKFHNAFYVTW